MPPIACHDSSLYLFVLDLFLEAELLSQVGPINSLSPHSVDSPSIDTFELESPEIK